MCDVDLYQMFHIAENDFLDVLQGGAKLLASYHQTWSTLSDNLSSAAALVNGTTSTSEAFSLVHGVASRVSNIARCYLDVKLEEESSASQLREDCDAMLQRMGALDLITQAKSLEFDSAPCSPPTTAPEETSRFPFAAHRWLLDNLHNPYPTATVKTQIATASSCRVPAINSWFTNARRRIGWTTLCRERFSNSRADMVEAAYRAFVEENPHRILSPELRHSFVAMKVAAESLYSLTFTRSVFAGGVDSVLKDAKEHKGSFGAGRCHQEYRANIRMAVRDSNPSSSIVESPPLALDGSVPVVGEGEDAVSPILTGSKRRRSYIEPTNRPSPTTRRLTKRLRSSQTYLPSLAPGTVGIAMPSDVGFPGSPILHSIQSKANEEIPTPMRHLSGANTGISECPHGSMTASREHIVSDPYSNTENEISNDDRFDTDFDSLFAIPPPAEATEPNFAVPWEVELFRNYTIPENLEYALSGPAADISVMADLTELDSLLRSVVNDTFVAASENVPLSGTTAPLLDSSISDISHIDWTSLLDASDTYQSIINPTFSHYPTDFQSLPEMDLAMLQLPPVSLASQCHGDSALKHARLDQLRAMQEAVRRMEQELQSEGVIL